MTAEAQAAFVGQNHVNLACFEVAGQLYALDVSQVREIVRTQPITPLPMSPDLIEGVVDLRGSVIPVIDLSRAIGCGRVQPSAQSRIVILEFDGLVFGLCVEAATDVLSLDASKLEDVPALASHAGYDAVRHVVRRADDNPVMVLSLEHLLENVYRSALPAQSQKSGGMA